MTEMQCGPLDSWYEENLVCPVDRTDLKFDGRHLISMGGRSYPVIQGIPVLLVEREEQTIGVAAATIQRTRRQTQPSDLFVTDFYLETLGISTEEKDELLKLSQGPTEIDPVVSVIIAATCGNAYKHLVGNRRLSEYPIPIIDLIPLAKGNRLLDIGCNWGRWSIAAARKGFATVGIDPSLGAIMAARRVAKQLNLDNKYLVADARFLPFRDRFFDAVYSYSVLQHFSKDHARTAIGEIGRVLDRGGIAKIQMANKMGLRNLYQQAERSRGGPRPFDVRYWSMKELHSTFSKCIGETMITADCFFGLGWQWSDFRYMKLLHKPILVISELLKRISHVLSPLRIVADSLFCTAVKASSRAPYER